MSTVDPSNPYGTPQRWSGSDGARSGFPSRRRRSITLAVIAFLVVAVFVIGALVRMPYVIYSPGPAQDSLGRMDGSDVISVQGTRTYPTDGTLDFTTVSLYGGPDHPVSFWHWARAKFDKNSVVQPEESVFGEKTAPQIKQESTAQMTGSQQSAEVVALRAAGVEVSERVVVGQVAAGGPALGRLQQNDQILSIDGRSIGGLDAVQSAMSGVRPGQVVTVEVKRAEATRKVQVTTRAGENGRALMGIVISAAYSFPFTVKINAGDVGGPSAGLMFSLAIYDKITPGQLTGGKRFAGTGEIAPDGAVGPIGGIRLKLVGAKDAGARFFLAPADNCDEVRGHVPEGLTVVKVSTFDQARAAVQKVAAGQTTGLPAC